MVVYGVDGGVDGGDWCRWWCDSHIGTRTALEMALGRHSDGTRDGTRMALGWHSRWHSRCESYLLIKAFTLESEVGRRPRTHAVRRAVDLDDLSTRSHQRPSGAIRSHQE